MLLHVVWKNFTDISEVLVTSITIAMNKPRDVLIALMMEAASTCETSVKFYQTILHKNPEDSHLHTRRREKLKFQPGYLLFDVV
jgi:hypothetical protein